MLSQKPQIDHKTASDLGLTEDEFERIKKRIGRLPNFLELKIFSAAWSERCSRKHASQWINTLLQEIRQSSAKVNESGLIDLGEDILCTLTVRTNNHDVKAEPYFGASIAVSETQRKLLAKGTRPIATINAIRLGDVQQAHSKAYLKTLVKGLSDYSNSVGIPTLNNDVFFNSRYSNSMLLSAFSLGITSKKALPKFSIKEIAQPIFIVGVPTLGAGLHKEDATFIDYKDDFNQKIYSPANPLQEKLLLEATLELVDKGNILWVENLGRSGIAYAAALIGSKNNIGISLELGKIPSEKTDIRPEEILLAEGEERLLLVGRKGTEESIITLLEKWDLSYAQIGETTSSEMLECSLQGEKIVELPIKQLVAGENIPSYKIEYQKPSYIKLISKFNASKIPKPKKWVNTAKRIWASQNVVSRKWIQEQFDSTIQTNTLTTNDASDAAILRIKNTRKALALTVGCNASYVFADPYVGAMIAVAQAARKITCSGGKPLAITTSLNFGSPKSAEIYWQFVNVVKGIGEVSKKFDLPNLENEVSFYNHSLKNDKTAPVFPTPIIGMIGLLEPVNNLMTYSFKQENHQIYMLGTPHNDFASSEYLKITREIDFSPVPKFDLDEEFHTQYNLRTLIRKGYIQSAHDIGTGGLFTSLLECAIPRNLGFSIETDTNFRKDAYLFGESQSRIVVSVTLENEDELVNYLNSHNVSFSKLGEVTGSNILIDEQNFGSVAEWKQVFNNWLEEKLEN